MRRREYPERRKEMHGHPELIYMTGDIEYKYLWAIRIADAHLMISNALHPLVGLYICVPWLY